MKNGNHVNSIEILLVEDNPADVRLTIETLKQEKICNNVQVVSDGEEALNFLHRRGKYSNAVRPDLILLDLNLPRIDGREVLKEIKESDKLKMIPVVVLTVSKAEEDIIKSYNLHANCFITKPIDLLQFARVARAIQDFWLTIVKLPPKE
ncbi:MAG: response regulator [bacterium]|nr:response regulator [bacterium]